MNTYCKFYIVRHAESEANKAGIRAGQMDYDLSDEGVEQAKKRAEELLHVQFVAAFSSDLLRAKRTAEIIAIEHKLEIQITKELRERTWEKELEGDTVEKTTKLLDEWNRLSYKERFNKKVFDDMESDEEIMSRFITFLRETAIAYMGKTVLIATHGNLMRTFMVHLGMGTAQEFPRESLIPTGYMVLDSDGVDFFVRKTVGIKKQSGYV